MTTLLYSHPICVEHDTGPGHPERGARVEAVLRALADPAFDALARRDAPEAAREQIERVHPAAYVDAVLAAIPETGTAHMDGDTVVSPASAQAAFRAAGAVTAAVDAIMAGEADNAFCAIRPPGHHAEPDRAMGFCLFSNAAIGALHARARYNCHRIAVCDFDVHHGNGTQAAFWDDPDLMLLCTHQMPLYPGSGAATERGCDGNIVNVPLSPGAGSEEFREAWRNIVIPRLRAFDPDFVFISAGFDAHYADPLAGLNFHEDDFAWATTEVLHVAEHAARGRVVSTLEGGYDLEALAACSRAHVGALMKG
jgi:acetoin utilization deacetylase AcuC-like enzyme